MTSDRQLCGSLSERGKCRSSAVLPVTSSSPSISECMDSEAETVMQLRNELRDKEMKLTDIRLEALSSAHQLDQLREAMNRMQVSGRSTEPQEAAEWQPRVRGVCRHAGHCCSPCHLSLETESSHQTLCGSSLPLSSKVVPYTGL